MAEKKLLLSRSDGSGLAEGDPDSYRWHFPNLEFLEKAKSVPTYTAETKDGKLSSGGSASSTAS